MVEGSFQPHLVFSLAVVVFVIGLQRGPLSMTYRTSVAAAPWAFAAAVFVVSARAGFYDVVVPEPTGVDLLAFVTLFAVVVWVTSAELASLRDHRARARYLGASGVGFASVSAVGFLTSVGSLDPIRLAWLAIVPVGALLFGAAGYFVLGLLYTDALVQFKLPGIYVLSAIVLDGFASAVAVEALGRGELGILTRAIIGALDLVGFTLSPWLVLPFHTFLGVVLVGCFGWFARQNEVLGNGCAVAISAIALCSASIVLLSATFLG